MLSSVKAYAEEQLSYYCDQISFGQGLNTVHTLCANRDNAGFLWIGTEQGLHRYDGQNMRLYSTVNDSLNFCKTFFITQDNQHHLWIGSDGGLLRYNDQKDQFDLMSKDYYPDYQNVNGQLYFVSLDHLLHYQSDKDSLTRINFKSDPSLNFYASSAIAYRNEHELYLSNGADQISVIDNRTGLLKKFFTTKGVRITDLVISGQGDLFVSTFGNGLYHLSSQGVIKGHYRSSNALLGSDVVVDLHLRNDSSLWIAVDGGGVYVMNTHTTVMDRLKIMSSNANNENLRTIVSIQEDADDNIYLATRRTGLYALKQNYIYSFLPANLNSAEGPSLGALLGFLEDDRHIWIATDGNGINRFEKGTMLFKHYPETFGMRVSSLDFTNEQQILFVAYRKGIYLFDKQTGLIKKKEIPSVLERKIQTGWVCPYLKRIGESDDYLLLLDSAYVYNFKNQHLKNLSVGNPFSVDMALRVINTDSISYTLFAYQGIYEFSLRDKELKKVLDMSKYTDEFIVSATKTDKDTYWLISNAHTVYSYNVPNAQLSKKTLPVPIKPLIIVGAQDRSLWLGTTHHLYRYLPDTNRIMVFGKSDGVQENEYIDRTFLRTRENELLLGGVNGFSLITPDVIRQKHEDPQIQVISVNSNGKELPKDKYISGSIELSPNNESLLISLLFKGRSLFDQPFYEYKLEGVMDNYEISNKSNLEFNHLPPGSHRLLIRFNQGQQAGCIPKEVCTIEVQLLWWQTARFKWGGIFLLLLISGFFLLKRKRTNVPLIEEAVIPDTEVSSVSDECGEEVHFQNQLTNLIRNHLSDPALDVDKLASLLAVSRSTLYTRMRQTVGVGVKEYINTIRIRKAEELLLTTDLPIIEISEQVGFSHQRYFSTVFKNIKGMTPTEYRTIQRINQENKLTEHNNNPN